MKGLLGWMIAFVSICSVAGPVSVADTVLSTLLKRFDETRRLIQRSFQRFDYQIQFDDAVCILRISFTTFACLTMIGNFIHIGFHRHCAGLSISPSPSPSLTQRLLLWFKSIPALFTIKGRRYGLEKSPVLSGKRTEHVVLEQCASLTDKHNDSNLVCLGIVGRGYWPIASVFDGGHSQTLSAPTFAANRLQVNRGFAQPLFLIRYFSFQVGNVVNCLTTILDDIKSPLFQFLVTKRFKFFRNVHRIALSNSIQILAHSSRVQTIEVRV